MLLLNEQDIGKFSFMNDAMNSKYQGAYKDFLIEDAVVPFVKLSLLMKEEEVTLRLCQLIAQSWAAGH